MATYQPNKNPSGTRRSGSAATGSSDADSSRSSAQTGQTQRRARGRGATSSGSSALEAVQERARDLVAERPWMMVGAAAGVGLALGAATRGRGSNELTRMLTGTATGIAMRFALNTLTQWFEREQSEA